MRYIESLQISPRYDFAVNIGSSNLSKFPTFHYARWTRSSRRVRNLGAGSDVSAQIELFYLHKLLLFKKVASLSSGV